MNRFENWKMTYEDTFVRDMVRYIKQHKIKVFRPHDSGDWYDQDYVDKFAQIASKCPKTIFFAYTKSLNPHIDLTPLTAIPTHNFTLIYSEGGKYDSKINKTTDNYATVMPLSKISNRTVREGEYFCPEIRASGRKTEKYCGHNCNYCVSSRNTRLTKRHRVRVIFPLRKGGWNGGKLFPRPPSYQIRPLLPLQGAPQPQKPTGSVGAGLPKRGKGEDPKAYRARLAKAVEAEFGYRHLLLAGYTTQNILSLAGISDLGELQREHVLKLMKMKMAAEELAKSDTPFKVLQRGSRKRKQPFVK